MKKLFSILCLVSLLSIIPLRADNVFSGLLNEVSNYVVDHSTGAPVMFNISDSQLHTKAGAIYNFRTSKHGWIYLGLGGTVIDSDIWGNPSIGFNLKKVIEKVKGSPCVIIKHLEIGYIPALDWSDLISDGSFEFKNIFYIVPIKFAF